MAETASHDLGPIRVMHVLRAPLGGLFRHVLDLSHEQARRGHEVGLIVDSTAGGEVADRLLADLSPKLSLGLSRVAMRRDPHLTDFSALVHVLLTPEGHASPRGSRTRLEGRSLRAASRLPPRRRFGDPRLTRLMEAASTTIQERLAHRGYMMVEALLGLKTDMLLFESALYRLPLQRCSSASRPIWLVWSTTEWGLTSSCRSRPHPMRPTSSMSGSCGPRRASISS